MNDLPIFEWRVRYLSDEGELCEFFVKAPEYATAVARGNRELQARGGDVGHFELVALARFFDERVIRHLQSPRADLTPDGPTC